MRAIGIAIAIVWSVYVLAANVILRTHLLRGWLTADGASLLVDYGSAWSWLPGRVVVRDVKIRHQDDLVQMSVLIDRASFDIDLFALTRHVASIHHVEADGVEYRLRQKVDSLDGRTRAFPAIEGLPESPLKTAPPLLRPGGGHPWTIEILEITASVRDVWTMEYHFRGRGTLTGGFHIEPNQIVQVLPSHMQASGKLAIGERDVIEGEDWVLDASVDPFEPKGVDGVQVLRYLSYELHQHGRVLDIAPFGDAYGMTLGDGAGTIEIDAHVDHGIVQADSRVAYRSERASFGAGALSITGDVDFAAHVDDRVRAKVRTEHASMSPASELEGVQAEIALRGLDTAAPIALDSLTTEGSGRCADLRAWNSLLHDTQIALRGAVSAKAHGEYAGGVFTGRAEAKLDRAGMTSGVFSVVASGTSETNIKGDEKTLTFPSAKADLHDVWMKLLESETQGLWVRARSNDLRVTFPGQADAHIALASGPGPATTKLFTGLAHLPDLAADIVGDQPLDAQARLRVRHDDVAVDVERAKDGVLEGAGRLHRAPGKKATGAFLVSAGRLRAGLDILPSGVSIVPMATDEWLKDAVSKR